MQIDERACPYCAETIKAAAVKCRWCNEIDSSAEGAGHTPRSAAASIEIRQQYLDRVNGGPSTLPPGWNSSTSSGNGIICPHCQQKGGVSTKNVKQKKGISGGKATGALLTGGLSILATGLSRKEKVTQLHCKKCGMSWTAAR